MELAVYESQRVAENELAPGEHLLWVGKPNATRMSLQTLPIMVFAIPWTAFAVFWVAIAAGTTSHSSRPGGIWTLFPLFGVPFILVGLGMLAAPLWAFKKATETVYAITDRRALIIIGRNARAVQSYADEDIQNIERYERSDGRGDIIFNRQYMMSQHNNSNSSRPSVAKIGFYGIPKVREVEHLLLDVFKRSSH